MRCPSSESLTMCLLGNVSLFTATSLCVCSIVIPPGTSPRVCSAMSPSSISSRCVPLSVSPFPEPNRAFARCCTFSGSHRVFVWQYLPPRGLTVCLFSSISLLGASPCVCLAVSLLGASPCVCLAVSLLRASPCVCSAVSSSLRSHRVFVWQCLPPRGLTVCLFGCVSLLGRGAGQLG